MTQELTPAQQRMLEAYLRHTGAEFVTHLAVVSIVKMSGEELAHEHIYWDQASVLAQLGR